MNGLNGMEKQVQRLEDVAPKPAPGLYLIAAEEFAPLDRLTQEEQAALEVFVARVQPKLNRGTTGPGPAESRGYPDMSGLSGQDLHEWGYWAKLGEALLQDDEQAAATYRRYLSESLDQLIERFFAIDEMCFPSKAEFIPGFHRFGFHREHFRYAKGCIKGSIDYNPRSAWTEEDRMREWLEEAYGNLEDL